MSQEKRINFGYVGEAPQKWTSHLKWSARILRIAGEPVPDKELDLELEREEAQQLASSAAPRRNPSDIPDHRRFPGHLSVSPANEEAFRPNISIPFENEAGLDIRFTDVEVYENGVAFSLVALTPDPNPEEAIASSHPMNLGHRIKPDKAHQTRVHLSLGIPPSGWGGEGSVVSNLTNPLDYPEDPRELWLYGTGGMFRRPEKGWIESTGKYFLSPAPKSGTVYVTISYPEFGLKMSTAKFNADLFRPGRTGTRSSN